MGATSDIRLKVEVRPIEHALTKVKAISGVTFRWKNTTVRGAGVIAQEIQAVLPEVVTRDDHGFLCVDQGQIVGLLIEAIKEQQAQIEELQRKIGG